MATFFLDYEGGNDGNSGVDFANRWKTITAGATAARIAPGDVIRVMGSPALSSLGINATWTNKSATVTLASALNALITNCDTAWTAAANVTCTADTSIYRTSTGSAKQAIAGAFGTGRAAHFGTGTLNLSAYQGITLWVRVSATLAASTLSIRLCSDTGGVTTVDNLPIPAISQANQWIPVYINKGSALGASIQSIALYGDIDPGAIDVYLDNISTVKAPGADALNLQSLIGKNSGSEIWWALRQINGTALTIDITPSMTVTDASRGYSGTTESVATYKRETIKTDLVASGNVQAVQDSGSTGSLITFSGGWDRTNMSTQTLETWFDGQSGIGTGIHGNGKTHLKFDKVHVVRYTIGFTFDAANHDHGVVYAGHCLTNGISTFVTSELAATEFTIWCCNGSGALGMVGGTTWNFGTLRIYSCGPNSSFNNAWDLSGGTDFTIGTLILNNNANFGIAQSATTAYFQVTSLTANDNGSIFGKGVDCTGNCTAWNLGDVVTSGNLQVGFAIRDNVSGQFKMKTLTAQNNVNSGLDLSSVGGAPDVEIGSLTTSGNGTGVVLSVIFGNVRILKSSLAEATKVTATSAGYAPGYVRFQNFNGVADDHRTYHKSGSGGATIFSEASVRHTASGIAWKISPLNDTFVNVRFPAIMPVARVLCKASSLVTLKIWLRRTNTGITGTFRVRGGQLAGVPNDLTSSISAAADTWQEQTLTFTPTIKGVLEVEVLAYGGTSHSVYVDDFTSLQA